MASKSSSVIAMLIGACAVLAVHGTPAASAHPAQSAPQRIPSGFGEGAYRPQSGVTNPVVLHRVEPRYTVEARRTNIEGEVELEAVIGADGLVAATRLVKSLDQTYGLDEEAERAARQWRFRPATYQGKPVPIVVRLILEFRLSSRPPQVPPPAPTPQPQPTHPGWVPDVEFLKGVALVGQPAVTMPVVERSVEPKYTAAAMRAKIAGTVTVDMVVGPDGSVVRSRIVRSLDTTYGLDRAALDAASQWRFTPGLVNGQRAHVLVTATMEFRLH